MKRLKQSQNLSSLGLLCKITLNGSRMYKRLLRRQVKECRKANLPSNIGITNRCTKIRPILEYGAPIWTGFSDYLKKNIERVQNRCLHVIGSRRNEIDSLTSRMYLTSREFSIRHPRIRDRLVEQTCMKTVYKNKHVIL